jgi:hypothetical protein
VLVAGFVTFAVQPGSPWGEILAALFGIGAGLTIDEFALWLYLEDVYWTEEGRSSVDVAIICALVAALVLVGVVPFSGSGGGGSVPWVVGAVVWQLAWAGLALAKGKVRMALFGLFVPVVAEVAAIRLARPNSPWARRRYAAGDDKLVEAERRRERWDARRERWLDRIGGAPHLQRGGSDD